MEERLGLQGVQVFELESYLCHGSLQINYVVVDRGGLMFSDLQPLHCYTN